MEELLRAGVVTSTHGLKGEVKVFPAASDPQRFKKLKQVLLDTGVEKKTLEIESVKFFKNQAILKFKGLDRIEEVEGFRGKDLFVERKDAVPLLENEYYFADLIGMDVETEEGAKLGRLTDVLETGANDVYVVTPKEGGDILIPAIRQCILFVDLAQKRMTVHLLDGLL